jgi:hypothetical protein
MDEFTWCYIYTGAVFINLYIQYKKSIAAVKRTSVGTTFPQWMAVVKLIPISDVYHSDLCTNTSD